jgi:hypothetical protein
MEAPMKSKKFQPSTSSYDVDLKNIHRQAAEAKQAGRIEDLQKALARETDFLAKAWGSLKPPERTG